MAEINCQGMLFDLDGVLVDSTPAVARVWTTWAQKHGFDPQETVHRAHGRPSLSTIRELLPDADHAAENARVEQMEIEDVRGVIPLPGTRELLEALPADRWTVVTSCTRALALVRLRVAGLPVPAQMVTSSDVANGKPHPEPYLRGAELLAVPPTECIVFEDAPAGVRSGKAARSRVVAFQTTASDRLLREAGADWIVKDATSVSLVNAHGAHGISLQLRNLL